MKNRNESPFLLNVLRSSKSVLPRATVAHCDSAKVKRNDIKGNGRQNFLCHDCKKQFQFDYQYRGADPRIKKQISAMAMRPSSIRDIANVLKISVVTVILTLRTWFMTMQEPQVEGTFENVMIDEFWSWVGHREKGKRWVWYA